LDYQFGFKISETWAFHFLERAIAPLILFQVITFYLLTCVMIVGPEERAFVERFGRPRNATTPLEPGLHLKWPWPIEVTRRFPAMRVKVVQIGEYDTPKGSEDEHDPHAGHGEGEEPEKGAEEEAHAHEDMDAILWTEKHAKSVFKWMVASTSETAQAEAKREKGRVPPVNFITGLVDVHYRIENLYDYVYKHRDAHATVRLLTYRALTRYMTGVDINELITKGRQAATQGLQKHIQDLANDHELGVKIIMVGIQDVHPPMEVAAAYESVVSAKEKKRTLVNEANAYVSRELPQAQGRAAIMALEAEAYAVERSKVTAGRATRFEALLKAYNKSPDLFRVRRGLMAIVEAIGTSRKYVVPSWSGANEVDVIDLQEKLQLDILDTEVPTE